MTGMIWLCALPALLFVALLIYIFRAGPVLPPETDRIIDDVLRNDLPEVVTGETGFAQSGDLTIWYESIAPDGPPRGVVLLLMGMGGDGLLWPPSFVRAFVDAGYRTIRFDYRSTGLSTWIQEWNRRQPYTLADMAGDAVAVLDALVIGRAHLVGLSLGGMVAQELAIANPDRAASLTLMGTSGFIGDPDLPGLSSGYLIKSAIIGLPLFRYRLLGGEKNLILERIAKTVAMIGPENLDIRETAELVVYDLRRRKGLNLRAARQHQAAVTIAGARYDRLAALDIPALIIHGTADPIIPVEHGRKLVAVIPGARGLWLDGVGHVFPFPDMEMVMRHLLAHLDGQQVST
jgi:pimeloyl-ACP methyl ester carboxylesterase